MRSRTRIIGLATALLLLAGLTVWYVTESTPPTVGVGAPGTGGAAAGAPGDPPPSSPTAPGSGSAATPGRDVAAPVVLLGIVADASSGDPIPRADVAAIPVGPTAPGLSTTTDGDGRFAFSALPTGRYRLHPVADGYHLPAADEPTVLVPKSGPGPDVELAMVPLAQLSGQIVEKRSGIPLGGTEVRCPAPEDVPEASRPGLGWIATGDDGRFDLICFPGEVVLRANKKGYRNGRSEPVRVEPAGHLGGIVIVLSRGKMTAWPTTTAETEPPPEPSTLIGRVVDASGSPAPSFRIHVVALRRRARPLTRKFVGDGSFDISGLWPGTYNVLASSAGSAPARVSGIELLPGAVTDVGELTLAAGAAADGHVTEAETGRPVPGVSISVTGSLDDVAPYLGRDVFTDDSGYFRLTGILPGRRSVEFSHPVYNHVVRTGVVFGEGGVERIDVTMTPRTTPGSSSVEYAGIGAVLHRRESDLMVQRVFDGGPARAAGLMPGDVVSSIDGVPTSELGFTDAIEALRGVAGTTVRIGITRGDETFVIDVVRAQLVTPPREG